MSSLSFNKNNRNNKNNVTNNLLNKNPRRVNIQTNSAINRSAKKYPESGNQIISGYFVKEKSYKEMAIARVNTCLCAILGFLVMACLVSYYFVTMSEVSLNQIRKETLALNYENEDLQNKLDNLQSYYNVDIAVAKSNMLQRATNVVELSAAELPNVRFNKQDSGQKKAWSMGY